MNKAVQVTETGMQTVKPIILFHGDKGGVGKSWTASIFADWMHKRGFPCAVVDGDTQNPDVARMFETYFPILQTNLRGHDGWMDLTDFMFLHTDKAIVASLPAGVGADLRREGPGFFSTLRQLKRPVSMFWIINRLPDSINLLSEALQMVGDNIQGKVVVKNLFFGEENKFSRWDNSETKAKFEKLGGKTVSLSELHERTVDKLFADNENIMPFSQAAMQVHEAHKSSHKLSPSENMELVIWIQKNHMTFDALQPALAL